MSQTITIDAGMLESGTVHHDDSSRSSVLPFGAAWITAIATWAGPKYTVTVFVVLKLLMHFDGIT